MLHLFWESIIEPLFQLTKPRTIVEIGSKEGEHTRKILRHCQEHDGVLHVIDPVPLPDLPEWQRQYGRHLVFHQGRSLDMLPTIGQYDAVLIDGDHNWYTVTHELKLIEKQGEGRGEGRFPLVLLHDTDWPYARRDMYHDPAAIPPAYRHPHAQHGVLPFKKKPSGPHGLNPHCWNALEEGDSRNGVLTAIEDFLCISRTPLTFTSIPGLHGLGIMLSEALLRHHPDLQGLLNSISIPPPLQTHINAIDRERIQQTINAEEARRETSTLQEDLVWRTRELRNTQLHLNEVSRDLEQTAATLDHVVHTRSWRMTAWLRLLEAMVRRFGKRTNGDTAATERIRSEQAARAVSRDPSRSSRSIRSTISPKQKTRDNAAVTIVIPVYRDAFAVEVCLQSCRAHVDPRHTIIVVNDCSPEPNMEQHILPLIQTMPNARYERNPHTLGFVKTCNRAVFELDQKKNDILLLNADAEVTPGFLEEMQQCLYETDRHGVACPRSNNATLLSVPVHSEMEYSPQQSFEQWKRLRHLLPRFHVIPTAVGFCMLVRRTMIERFGLFDSIYSRGYNEENDFCCRLGRCGFSTIMCNQSFVFHSGCRSFTTSERSALEIDHRKMLLKRYPEYADALERYFQWEIDPCDHFGEILTRGSVRPRFLFDLSGIHPAFNGTNEYAIALLERIIVPLREQWDVTITAEKAVDRFFSLSQRFPELCLPHVARRKRYDLAFVPHQIFTLQQLTHLNHCALRWLVTIHDIISLRVPALRNAHLAQAFATTLHSADGLICISKSVWHDMLSYFGPLAEKRCGSSTVIYNAVELMASRPQRDPNLPAKYLLLAGNQLAHKAIDRALEVLDPDIPVVVLCGAGVRAPMRTAPTIFLESGRQSPALLESLYQFCTALIFPSQYEGCGLPLLHAVRCGRPAVAFFSESMEELIEALNLSGIRTVESWEELNTVARALFHATPPPTSRKAPGVMRTWNDVADETLAYLQSVMGKAADPDALRARWHHVASIERSARQAPEPPLKNAVRQLVNAVSASLLLRRVHPPRARTSLSTASAMK